MPFKSSKLLGPEGLGPFFQIELLKTDRGKIRARRLAPGDLFPITLSREELRPCPKRRCGMFRTGIWIMISPTIISEKP